MIGRFPIGRRPVGKFRLIVRLAAITGSASVAFTLSTAAAGNVSVAGTAAAGFVVSTVSAGSVSVSGAAAAGFVLSSFASGTVAGAITDYDPSTRRQLSAAGSRGLTAGSVRMVFGGNNRGGTGG